MTSLARIHKGTEARNIVCVAVAIITWDRNFRFVATPIKSPRLDAGRDLAEAIRVMG
jgi:hypothetical protein